MHCPELADGPKMSEAVSWQVSISDGGSRSRALRWSRHGYQREHSAQEQRARLEVTLTSMIDTANINLIVMESVTPVKEGIKLWGGVNLLFPYSTFQGSPKRNKRKLAWRLGRNSEVQLHMENWTSFKLEALGEGGNGRKT